MSHFFPFFPQAWPQCRLRTAGPDLPAPPDSSPDQQTITEPIFSLPPSKRISSLYFVSGLIFQHCSHFLCRLLVVNAEQTRPSHRPAHAAVGASGTTACAPQACEAMDKGTQADLNHSDLGSSSSFVIHSPCYLKKVRGVRFFKRLEIPAAPQTVEVKPDNVLKVVWKRKAVLLSYYFYFAWGWA